MNVTQHDQPASDCTRPSETAISGRISALEARNRQMVVCLLGLAAILLCLVCFRSGWMSAASAAPEPSETATLPQVLRTHAVEITDASGAKRMAVEAREPTAPRVIMYKSTGTPRALLIDGSFCLIRGKRVSLSLSIDQQTRLLLSDTEEQVRVGIAVLDKDLPALFVNDENGELAWVAPPLKIQQQLEQE